MLQAFENDGYHAVCALDQDDSPLPTRWGGSRCIDYAICNTPGRVSKVRLLDDAFADHFVFACEFKLHNYCKEPQTACSHHRTNDLSRPKGFCKNRWQELCREEFSRLVPLVFPEETDQDGIDSLWSALSLRYEMAARHAKRRALQETLDSELPDFGNRPAKGKFLLRSDALQMHPELKVGDGFRLRKLCNILARLREMQKHERLNKQLSSEYLNLQAKVRQSPLVSSGSVAQQAAQVEQAIQAERNSAAKARTAAWKESLRSSQGRRFRWLKTAAPQPSRGLHMNNNDRPTRSAPESLALIKRFWNKVWVLIMTALLGLLLSPLPSLRGSGIRSGFGPLLTLMYLPIKLVVLVKWSALVPRRCMLLGRPVPQALLLLKSASSMTKLLGLMAGWAMSFVDWPVEFFEAFR